MDGKFDPAVDEVVPNATVISGNVKAVTGPDGSYLLRGLPAGTIEVTATSQEGRTSPPTKLELPAEALIKSGVNLAIPH
ncbi:MAG TPA: carboxypeptidase-like regulatory domain-containing protein, partial [Pyrinomonadaceae bacterium]|nr:carboxypeptidase-like regulatory domain-containing protein [Pyrinomonadaceae bacterium]